ncbi:WD repeat-containing protein on Y chromosome [Nibea albiflora]|uniref:WD repeat-containing protein on Y chromosome n=1 Tax=Nibea albiflora TaxID=240163 RepID=A0ACB7FAW6_NIBAL|nr:WD repeat-containing protein on Y chromosome [Nibea albiflora]
MFSLRNLRDTEKAFEEADIDGGGGLDIDEFRVAMTQILGDVNVEDLIALHMKIDTNCDGTVDLGELTDYFLDLGDAVDFKNEIFPNPFKIVPVDCRRRIAALTFCQYGGTSNATSVIPEDPRQIWPCVEGHYISISTNGILTVWGHTFQDNCALDLCKLSKSLPLSHMTKISVTDMVFITELKQAAISTMGRQLLFYTYNEFPQVDSVYVECGLNVDYVVTTMNYWSNGTKGIFSFGTDDGCLLIFISYEIKVNGLFNKHFTENPSLQDYPTYYVQKLLSNKSKDYLYIKIPIFDDVCKHISYFPSLDSFAVCGKSSERMALVTVSRVSKKASKRYFKSEEGKKFFTCVTYSDWTKSLVTGGTDGVLRVWHPQNVRMCARELAGHKKPITHVMYNPRKSLFVSLSADKKVCVWSDVSWQLLQSFEVGGLGQDKLSAAYYNTFNNELVVANINIGACLGYGTDVLQNSLTSHEKPLCNALYHSIYKQVISICQNGVVIVWDILTGEAVMKFKVSPDECMGLTAISFDGVKRRLIAVSEDGIMKLWNFNNGKELCVLPIPVHKKVTCIVCTEDRVFMSGRNSKIIYDLNINENDYRFLEHDYTNDISSLDVHDNKLIAAASNGNIVIWDIETSRAFLCFNINTSLQIQSLGIHNRGCTGWVSEMKKHTGFCTNVQKGKSDFQMICLKTRMATASTATLLTSANGYISAWSLHQKGHLLAKFKAVNDEGAVITTMSTDEYEKTLLTGDSTGQVCLWNIQCFEYKTQTSKEPHEDAKKFHVSLHPPPLLHSWQAHLTRLVSVKCDTACTRIITAGVDCNVRLWTNTGCYIGLFGKDKWDPMQVSPEGNPDQVQKTEPPDTQEITKDRPDTQEITKDFPCRQTIEQILSNNKDPDVELAEKNYECLKRMSKELQQIQQSNDVLLQEQLPRRSQNQFRPRPPQTKDVRDGTEHELGQSSPLNHTRKTKYGRVLRNQKTDTLKDDVPKPNNVPDKQGPEQKSKHVLFPSIPHKVQLTSQRQLEPLPPQISLTMSGTHMKRSLHMQQSADVVEQEQPRRSQNQFKPHAPRTPCVRDGTEHELGQSSPLNHTRKTKYGRVLRNQKTDTLKDDVLKPNNVPDKQGSEQTSKHVRFPSIPHKVQLTSQRQLEILSPQMSLTTGGTGMKSSLHMQQSADVVEQEQLPRRSQNQFRPQPPQTKDVRDGTEHELGQSSPLNHTRKTKYGRVLRNQKTDTLKDDVPKPNNVPDKQGPEQTSKHVRFPSIPHKVQLTSQRQLEPMPPQISLTTSGTHMKSSLHMQQSADVVEQEQPRRSQNQFKPHPPRTPCVRDGTEHELGQSSPLNHTRKTKYGRVLRNQKTDTF